MLIGSSIGPLWGRSTLPSNDGDPDGALAGTVLGAFLRVSCSCRRPPRGSIYCPVEDSGSKNYTRYGFWNQNPKKESLHGQCMDPLGCEGKSMCHNSGFYPRLVESCCGLQKPPKTCKGYTQNIKVSELW